MSGHDWDRPSRSEMAEEQRDMDFWNDKRKYPRGSGPPNGTEYGSSPYADEDGNSPYHVEEEAPDKNLIHDPGFPEVEVDTHYDPDHGREDKLGGILTQAQQWPDRVASYRQAEHDGLYESELAAKKHKPPVGGDIKRVKGLYGEDENDPYDVYAQRSPNGKDWDVVRPVHAASEQNDWPQ